MFLAAKLEEDVKKYRDVINTFHRLERRREGKSLDFVEQVRLSKGERLPLHFTPHFLHITLTAAHVCALTRVRRSRWTF